MIPERHITRTRWWFTLFSVLTLLVATISLMTGDFVIPLKEIVPTLFGQGAFTNSFILLDIRLPRVCIVILCGIALATSGAILQSLSRNDLADPGIIGINNGAGVAVSIFFLFFPIETGSFMYMLPIVACIGGAITALLIYLFSYDKQTGLHPTRLILVGIGFSLALSGVMIVLMSSSENEKVNFIAKWLAGNIWGTDWLFVWALLPWLLILIPFTLYKAQVLNILTLQDMNAIGVGMSLKKERFKLLFVAVALAAAAVAVSGSIAFIGLIAPHMAKALVGPRHQLHLPIAMVIGALFLLIADTISRNLAGAGLPTGILVSLIGAPYFIYLLLKS